MISSFDRGSATSTGLKSEANSAGIVKLDGDILVARRETNESQKAIIFSYGKQVFVDRKGEVSRSERNEKRNK